MKITNRWHRSLFPSLWRWKRKRVLELNPYCLECGSIDNLQCHHVDGDPKNARWDNLATLCKTHNIPNHKPYLESPVNGELLVYFEGIWIPQSALVEKCWISSDCFLENGHDGPHEGLA